MKQRLNPVLPPPRRPRLYGWDQDTTYTGKMGGKWVGNAEHAGQTRYQTSKPSARKGNAVDELKGVHGKHDEEKTVLKGKYKQARADVIDYYKKSTQEAKDGFRKEVAAAKEKHKDSPESLKKALKSIRQKARGWAEQNKADMAEDLEAVREEHRELWESLHEGSRAAQGSARQSRDKAAAKLWRESGAGEAKDWFMDMDPEMDFLEFEFGSRDDADVQEAFPTAIALTDAIQLAQEHWDGSGDPEDVAWNGEQIHDLAVKLRDELLTEHGYGDLSFMTKGPFWEMLEGVISRSGTLAKVGEKARKMRVSDVNELPESYQRKGANPVHYGKLNPVLPPPRRLLNPVEALLTARSPAQVRLHFARYRRALLYEWERDPKYQGAKGSKWIGTGDDAGKTPRYQASKPGSGRGKKEPATTGGRGKKDEGTGKGVGGKPSQKEAHADIVQHLRDVLSGEGEEADALFAKLQDRLQGMSPAERKEAAEKLGAVLGGKKPAAKKEPKAKPTPAEKPAPAKRTPAAAKKKPQKGDVNAKGQVFDGRYWRKPEGAEKPKEKPGGSDASAVAQEVSAMWEGRKGVEITRNGVDALVGKLRTMSKPEVMKIAELVDLVKPGRFSREALAGEIGERLMSLQGATDRVAINHRPFSEAGDSGFDFSAGIAGEDEPPAKVKQPAADGHKDRLKKLIERPHDEQARMSNAEAIGEIEKLSEVPTPQLSELVANLGIRNAQPTRKGMLDSILLKLTEARRARESIEV